MLKIATLALGFLTVITIAPSARSTNFQISRTRSDASSQLHAEKLVPIKKSVKIAPTVIKTTSTKARIDRKVELSAESKERQRIQTACARQLPVGTQFGSNERAVGMFESSKTADSSKPNANGFTNADSFNNSSNQGSCGFSIGIPY